MKAKVTPYQLGLMLKAMEAATGESGVDAVALEAARAKSGSDRDKLAAYVGAHSQVQQMAAALGKAQRVRKLATALLMMLAGLLGALAVMSALLRQGEPALNIFWLLSTLLGPASIALLIWGFLILRKSGGLSRLWMRSITEFLSKRFSGASDINKAATQVVAEQHIGGALGRWRLSVLSHGFWLVYLLSACLVFVFIMAFQRYVFIWETTLLTTDQAIGLFSALRAPVTKLGLPAPSVDDIQAAQALGGALPTEQVSQIWAQFTLALLILFGVLPRLFALAASTWRVKHLLARQRLASTDPFFAEIAAQIYRPHPHRQIIDEDDSQSTPPSPQVPAQHEARAISSHSVVGWELDDGPLPGLNGASFLGSHEREEGLYSALGQAQSQSQSQSLAIAVSLTNTPDRGTARILQAAKQHSDSSLTFILLDQSKLAQRLPQADQERRLADWWALLMKIGVSPDDICLPEAASFDVHGGE